MINVRDDEPSYSFLADKDNKTLNQYGKKIELTHKESKLRGKSLTINHDKGVGENPNRYKQHGFYFNADNCIGCHACESACSEKNDNPAHIAFRSVGYVEGGSYPDYQRLNISMACNHCDDPVCLKGCPTRAYTKYAEYGAVLQDPDICFGCGYCTWVCPYNAPQLDPVKGEVSKCNMCVDRLEVGLKPSCVSACVGNALDFGVTEDIPDNRIEAKTSIPGFPSPEITQPNIRFQQTRSTHREMTRTDSMPLKYHKADGSTVFKSQVDKKQGEKKEWNWRKLMTSHESAHVIFTLFMQGVLGAFLMGLISATNWSSALIQLNIPLVKFSLLAVMFVLLTFGLFKLNMHLGKPHRFYRGFNNLRLSPLSREIAGVTGFYTFLMAYGFLSIFDNAVCQLLANVAGWLGATSGLLGLYYMHQIYRIKARPFWDHWQTATAFVGSTLSFGALLAGMVSLPILLNNQQPVAALFNSLLAIIIGGLSIELIGHIGHHRDMNKLENEGSASWYLQATQYGKSWLLRNTLLVISLLMAATLLITNPTDSVLISSGFVLAILMLATAAISRSLFFVVVIPTTMPGAFFWKNKGFQEHARETGLADMAQVGVVHEQHGKFKLDELLHTITAATPRSIFNSIKDIVVWKSVS